MYMYVYMENKDAQNLKNKIKIKSVLIPLRRVFQCTISKLTVT